MAFGGPKAATARARLNGYASGLEVSAAKDLEQRKIAFEYEQLRIPWLDVKQRHYRPDFLILKNYIIVETKGLFSPTDRRKHVEVKEQHPDLDIRFVFTNPNSKLYKGSKTTYAMWCEANGFMYAKQDIPEDWLKEKLNRKSKAAVIKLKTEEKEKKSK